MATKRQSTNRAITAKDAPSIAQICAPLPHNLRAEFDGSAFDPQLATTAIRHLHELTMRLRRCAICDDQNGFIVEFDRARKLVRSLEPTVQSLRYKWAEVCAVRMNMQVEFRGVKQESHHQLLYEVCRERMFVVLGSACPKKFSEAIAGTPADFDSGDIRSAWPAVRRAVRTAGIFSEKSADLLPLVSAELGAIGISAVEKKGTAAVAKFLGDGRYQVGDDPPFSIGDSSDAAALAVLVELGSATGPELQKNDRCLGVNPSLAFKRIRERFPSLAPSIFLPGKNRRGGYRTTIIDARQENTQLIGN